MYRIIPPADFVTSPWKNGGGVTHEIARDRPGEGWGWRLSIAEVASDGPFSHFPGYARILTVIEGAGLDLHGPGGTLAARPLQPLAFSGDLPIDSRMVAGPIRDLNLIYDASRIAGAVTVLQGPTLIAPPLDLAGLLCLSEDVAITGRSLAHGAFALGRLGQISLAAGAAAILVTLPDRQAEASNPATA